MLASDSDQKLRALQKIGKTRFGTYWTSAQSLLPALPKIRSLVQAKEIKFKVSSLLSEFVLVELMIHFQDKKIHALFQSQLSVEYHRLELALVQYVAIIGPLMRSLWSLEASAANASDVFVFLTASAASLRDLFQRDSNLTGIPASLANAATEIFNDEYDEFFLHTEIYFAAFALDPRESYSA